MAKIIDKLAIFTISFFLAIAWCLYCGIDFFVAVFLGIFVTIPILLAWAIAKNYAKNRKVMSTSDLLFHLSIMGQVAQTTLFANTIPPQFIIGKDSTYILVDNHGKATLIFANYKFGKTLKDEVAKCYRKARELNAKEVLLLVNTDRGVIATSRRLDIHFRYPTLFEIKRYLFKHNALPQAIKPYRDRFAIKLKDTPKIFANILQQHHAKRYFFIGLMLAITALITPLKLYYLIMATVVFAIGLLCLIFGNK